ncbi:cell division protein ZapA [Ferrovum sp.]|uniref:cell division protein ZapA n=1 Tax=Ferrovum sp. TaxID=2609467 RepID=UPI00261709D4|nr:cell division protein ZapA [Ferrovum sp.]
MTRSATKALEIVIYDRTYRVACEEDQHSLLREAAQELDRRMREARSHAEVGPERAAVMVALNAIYEMMEQKIASSWDVGEVKHRIKAVEEQLDRCFFEQVNLF